MSEQSIDMLERQLLEYFDSLHSVAVAYSGGVDSAVVACAAHRAMGDRAVAVTADSPSISRSEFAAAKRVAAEIGIEQVVVWTGEFDQQAYRRNDFDRCFHCKSELYRRITEHPRLGEMTVIVNGANSDDLQDFRPGQRAAAAWRVRSPLAELGIGKLHIRQLARIWHLSVAGKPSSPCLASRVAYSVSVTPQRMLMIDRAEEFIRGLGINVCRVRLHAGELARIEIPQSEFEIWNNLNTRNAAIRYFQELGFQFVTVDLQGFRSGSLNQIVPAEVISQSRSPAQVPEPERCESGIADSNRL